MKGLGQDCNGLKISVTNPLSKAACMQCKQDTHTHMSLVANLKHDHGHAWTLISSVHTL